MPWYPQRRRRTPSSGDVAPKRNSLDGPAAIAVPRRPRCSLPGWVQPTTDTGLNRSSWQGETWQPKKIEVREDRHPTAVLCNAWQAPGNNDQPSDDMETRRELYGWPKDCASRGKHTSPKHKTPAARRPSDKSEWTLTETEPIYEVIDICDDAGTFSPGITPWDDDEDDVREERLSANEISPVGLSKTSPLRSPRRGSSFAVEQNLRPLNSKPLTMTRAESSVELGIIRVATGETSRWEQLRRIRVTSVSVPDAEALLLQHERGPGTFLFREQDGQIVLTLWDGTSVHHFHVRDHNKPIAPIDFQAQRFRDFVRCYRGGGSGSLPSALRYIILVDPTTPPPPKGSSFTIHAMSPQTQCSEPSRSQYGARTQPVAARFLAYDRILDHATKHTS
eukprot:m.275150 g.275150  ORF g.275150 m.275150 type:complete len:392 (+) comp16136_c0_seq5:429-1604(+)